MRKMRTIVCKNCGKSFETKAARQWFCSVDCKMKWRNMQKFPDGSEYVECM